MVSATFSFFMRELRSTSSFPYLAFNEEARTDLITHHAGTVTGVICAELDRGRMEGPHGRTLRDRGSVL